MDVEDRIKKLEFLIKQELRRDNDHKDYVNLNPQRRMELEIELLKLGCRVDQDIHGLLVNRKFIVAVRHNKWCVKGKFKWYYYKDIPTFVNKYVGVNA